MGDFEADLIYGEKTYLVTVIDRASRKGFIKKVYSKEADVIKNTLIKIFKKIKEKENTIVFDNGL